MFLVRIAVILAVGLIVWCILKPRHAIRIIAGPGGVTKCDGISKFQYSTIAAFFSENMRLEEEVTVFADRDSHGSLRIQVRGTHDAGIKQQIRNFLKLTL